MNDKDRNKPENYRLQIIRNKVTKEEEERVVGKEKKKVREIAMKLVELTWICKSKQI